MERAAKALGCEWMYTHHTQIQECLSVSGAFLPGADHTEQHLLYIAWEPLLAHAARLSGQSGTPQGRRREPVDVERATELLAPAFKSLFGEDAPLDMQATTDLCSWLSLFLNEYLGCDLEEQSIQEVLAHAVPFSLASTKLNAFTLLACGAFRQRLGPCLEGEVRRGALALVQGQEDRVTPEDFTRELTKELMDLRKPKPASSSLAGPRPPGPSHKACCSLLCPQSRSSRTSPKP